jgi:hypothetical protein
MPIIATTIVSTLAQTAGTISQVADAKKRREYEQGLSMLTLEERQRLERDLLRTTSKDKRLEVLANAFAQIKSTQTATALTAKQKAEARRETLTAIIVVGGAALILLTVVLLKRK